MNSQIINWWSKLLTKVSSKPRNSLSFAFFSVLTLLRFLCFMAFLMPSLAFKSRAFQHQYRCHSGCWFQLCQLARGPILGVHGFNDLEIARLKKLHRVLRNFLIQNFSVIQFGFVSYFVMGDQCDEDCVLFLRLVYARTFPDRNSLFLSCLYKL